jgi:5-methylcytosine-specific restriction endonuclease McrA
MKTPEEKRLAAKEYGRIWRNINRERFNESRRKWVLANPSLVKGYQRKHYAKNKKNRTANTRKWRANNPEKISAIRHLRYARKRNATIGDPKTIAKWEKSWRTKKFAVCYWCSARVSTKKCHMDHINPIGKNGEHSIENLCISCQPCNNKKWASDLKTWNSRIKQPVLF